MIKAMLARAAGLLIWAVMSVGLGGIGLAQAGTLGAPAIAPGNVTVGAPTPVLFSIAITDPKYLPGSANLQRLKADGSVDTVVGLLRDDGLEGDAVAGDRVFTLRATILEAAAGSVRFQFSAGFRGELKRTVSAPMTLTVVGAVGAPTIGAVTIGPASTPAGVPLISTATAVITDATVVPSSIVLQKVDNAGRVLATLGPMHDDGLDGDAVAGDKTFSLRTTVLENLPGTASYRVAAAFQGYAQTVYSAPLSVAITGVATGIAITSPANGAYLNTPVVTISGTVGDAAARVSINGIVTPVSNKAFATAVPLNEGPNTINAVATNSNGTTSTASSLITLDTTAPKVQIYSPASNGNTTAASVTVTGLVNDIVVGTVNPQQATVVVNGVQATVLNRSFMASNVPLTIGSNTVQAVATDRAGNRATNSVTVVRAAANVAGLSVQSGNNQSALVGSNLPAPLVVKLTDAQGLPQVNKPVVFRVISQDGTLSPTGAPGTGLSAVAVNTDAQGLARTFLKLGSRSGVGNNLVEASTVGLATTGDFSASGTPGAPQLMVVDSGNNQSGVVGQPLPLPLIAIVTDGNNNRLANVPVTFEVKGGAGNFAGNTTFQTSSDGDGRVAATLTLGPDQGVNNNVVEVSFTGNTGYPAAFAANGLVPGPADQTRISGVVLDNSNNPIPGVTMRLLNINQGNFSNIPQQVVTPVRTDAQGQFVLTQVPVGVFKLMADGSTALRSGTWPTLEYDMITVSGQNNTVGMPVYLPELQPGNRLCVNDTTGGTLTIPEAPGFALAIAPGSATFPGGSRTGCVFVTTVHPDKSPMSPGFGQQPRFLVTIQPVGTVFNPPARMTMPNVDGLAPRAVTEMYSYDHDLASFVAIGSATVSEDGSSITSDAGSGVIKAGWHCGGNPAANGTVADCPECKSCRGNQCVADDTHLPANPCKTCKNGAPADITITNPQAKVEGLAEAWKLLTSNKATFAFTGSATSPDCPTLVYKWEFGDGATANGASVSHEYTGSGERTVTLKVSCSTCPTEVTATAKAVALELKHETIAKKPADRQRLKIGVGEEVKFEVVPAKTVDWSVVGGGTLSSASGSVTIYTAANVAGTPTIKVDKAPFLSGSQALTVIEPNALSMVKASEDTLGVGNQGVGMLLNVTMRPLDVSFYRLAWQEQPGPATGLTGYFSTYAGPLNHVPSKTWFGFGEDNLCGCQDHAADPGNPPPWTNGTFSWVIPNHFQIVGASPDGVWGNGKLFTNTTQAFTLEGPPNAGRETITKAGATVTRKPSDP